MIMHKRLVLTISLLFFFPLSAHINSNDQFEQVSKELEECMNEDFDNLDTTRFGKVDKDYDALCDKMPLKKLPKWRQWINSIGGSFLLRAVLLKRFMQERYIALKNSMNLWWNGKPKQIPSLSQKGY